MADLELALNLTADGNDLRAEVRVSNEELEKLRRTNEGVGKSGKQAGDGLDEGGRKAQRFRNRAKELNNTGTRLRSTLTQVARAAGFMAGILGGISLAAMIQDMASTIHMAELLEGALLSAVGGIPELADQAFAALEGFASRTPFALEQSVNAFIKMQNLGILPTEERMAAFGNTAAAMGKDLNQMIEAVADASTGEFERLKEFGIKASQEGNNVSFTFQGVTTTVKKSSEAIVGYLTDIGNNRFGDAMRNQMERLPGLWSNLKDSIEGVWRDLGDAGVTAMFESWLRTGIGWLGDIRTAIKAGWFDWVGAELGVLQARWGNWWDVAVQTFQSYTATLRNLWESIFSIFTDDNSLESVFSSALDIVDVVIESMAVLPINFQAIVAIGIGEFEKLRIGAVEKFQLLVNSGKLAWENLSFSISSTLSGIELAAARTVESVIQEFGRMVSQLGETLAAINSTSLGDALVPDDALAKIQSAGAAMQSYQGLTSGINADIAAATAAHQERVVALEAERAGITAAADARREAADEFIDAALESRDAALETRDAQIAEAEAAAAATRASYEQNRALKSTAPTIDDVTGKLKGQGEATGEVNQELEDLLDELFTTRRVLREYEADLGTLQAALAKGELSQEEFNAAVARLRSEASESIGAMSSLGDALVVVMENTFDQLDDIGREYWSSLVREGKISVDSILDLVENMLIEISYAFARNQALQYFGSADGSTAGGFGGLVNSAFGGGPSAPSAPPANTGGLTGVSEGSSVGAGASAAGASTVASLSWAALFVGIFRTLDDLQSGRYGIGDVLTGNHLHEKYADSFGPIGEVLFPSENYVDPLGLGDLVNDLTGFKRGGNNAVRGSFDLATGRTSTAGVGNNYSEANESRVDTLLEQFLDFAERIGGSTFSGNIKVGNRSGFSIDGQKFSDPDEFMAFVFEDIVRGATNLSAEVQDIILTRGGGAEDVQRNTSDAQLLNTLLRRQGPVFTDVEGLTPTFDVLADQFRGVSEGFTQVFERFDLGLVIMDALGESTERTVANMSRAQELVDQLGLETSRGIAATLSAIGDGVSNQFETLQENLGRTNTDILATINDNVRTLIASYDGSAEAANDLAQATQARREAELALLSELSAVTDNIVSRAATFREQLILDGLDDEGKYERYREQIAALGEQIATAGSAAELDRISADADRLGRAAFGLLDEDQRDLERAGFIEWLDAIEQAALDRAAELEEEVVDNSGQLDAETNSVIWEKAGLAGENLQTAGDSLQSAAAQLQSAAASQEAANAGQADNNAALTAAIEQLGRVNSEQSAMARALLARQQSQEGALVD